MTATTTPTFRRQAVTLHADRASRAWRTIARRVRRCGVGRRCRTGADAIGRRALAGISVSLALCASVLVSARAVETNLGAPVYWTWLLTGLQVLALRGAGGGRCWGWWLGAAVQPAWIVYALLTGQLGFVPGCLVSTAVQAMNSMRCGRR